MSTSGLKKCEINNADATQSHVLADGNMSSACDTHVAMNVGVPTNLIKSRKRIEVAILMVSLVLLVFQGMTFAFVKRVDENLQTIIQTDGIATNTEMKADETAEPKFQGHRRSLSIAH